MEILFCQYSGSKLDEHGNCPSCQTVEAPEERDSDSAEDIKDKGGTKTSVAESEIPAGMSAETAAKSSEPPVSSGSHARPAKKKHTGLVVLLILCCICIAAAATAFMTFSNPRDIAHYQAGNAAWKAKDWEAAQSEFSQVSERFYKYGSVQEALRILRIEVYEIKVISALSAR